MSIETMNSLLIATTVGIAMLLLRSFFPSYFSEKGKNLATKEDIGEITAAVESVKEDYTKRLKELEHQNALVLEQLRMNQQLRLAAVEKRMAAHQEAFALWRRLIASAYDDSLNPVVIECQDWLAAFQIHFHNASASQQQNRFSVRRKQDVVAGVEEYRDRLAQLT